MVDTPGRIPGTQAGDPVYIAVLEGVSRDFRDFCGIPGSFPALSSSPGDV
jgi:hypothetical protein